MLIIGCQQWATDGSPVNLIVGCQRWTTVYQLVTPPENHHKKLMAPNSGPLVGHQSILLLATEGGPPVDQQKSLSLAADSGPLMNHQ